MHKSLETSVLICSKNSENSIKNVLEQISSNKPKEIIVIDGCSTDKTVEIAKIFTNKIFLDDGKGLGYARKLGVSKVTSKYLVIVSPDDIISQNFISLATEELKNSDENIAALLAPKRLKLIKSFCDYGQDAIYRMQQKFKLRTVGNPSIYRTKYLVKYQFDEIFSANEDTDLCERWHLDNLNTKWGKTFFTYESETRSWDEFKKRYIWYGEGDYNFFIKWIKINKKTATRHFLHPLITYGFKYTLLFMLKLDFKAALFSICCCVFRYVGFVKKIK
jgi:glycosyltransferase involved in cell wall biosynthesis